MSVTTRAAPALQRSGGVGARSPHGPAGHKRRRRGLTAPAGSPARLRDRGSGTDQLVHRPLPRQRRRP